MLKKQTQNMKYSLLFHNNNGYANARQYYVKSTLPGWILPNFPSNIFIAENRSVLLCRCDTNF